ncbi:MAG: DUF2730 family protein [Gemmatimonadetes bacterium]|nr:DUF2730 family protein [Gemmatimonadota bacterium]MYG15442.1 DUF2730 family protein [Gemmatimonadota bacterium]
MTVYLEDRVTKLEKQYDHIVTCLAGLADSFVKLDKRMDALEQKVDGLEQKVDRLEQRVDRLEQKVDGLEQKVDGLERKVDRILEIIQSNQ